MAKRLLSVGAIAAIVLLLAGCTVFGDGSFVVGIGNTEATPGTYRSTGGPDCHWQRTTDFSRASIGVIADDFLSGPDVVTILPSDGGFQSQGCGIWTPLPAFGPEVTQFGDGAYAVGVDIAPGTYSAPGGNECFWEQDSNFLWNGASIISSGGAGGPVTVTLAANAAAFKVQHCGIWTSDTGPAPGSNCFLNPAETCYTAGESCPNSVFGLTVQGEFGPITCVDIGGVLLWENAAPGTTCFLNPAETCYTAGESCPDSLLGLTVQGEFGPISCVDIGGVLLWENAAPGTSCFLNPAGQCYRVGQDCTTSLHGVTVEGENGLITCVENSNGLWEWRGGP
jgi:hypothetical protein